MGATADYRSYGKHAQADAVGREQRRATGYRTKKSRSPLCGWLTALERAPSKRPAPYCPARDAAVHP